MQLAREELEQAYRQMKTIREFEDHLHREIAKGTIGGFTHLYGGQEAVAVGVCENLRESSKIIFSNKITYEQPSHFSSLNCARSIHINRGNHYERNLSGQH
mgnify:CR=1 FL=1